MSNAPTTHVIITGARFHPDVRKVTTELARIVLDAPGWVVVRHGACPGEDSVDQAVHEWIADCGEALGVIEDAMPADWDHCTAACPEGHRIRKRPGDVYHPGKLPDYCPAAGVRRNRAMVEKQPKAAVLIAAPYRVSRGTKNCIRLAKQAQIPVRIIWAPVPAPKFLSEAMF